MAHQDDHPEPLAEQTKEQVAVAAYDTFMMMMTVLQTRLDIASAKNYMSIQLHGMVAPFDRAEINFIRVGGKSPRELQKDLHHISLGVLDMIERIAKGDVTIDDDNRESLLTFVHETRNKLPPMQHGE